MVDCQATFGGFQWSLGSPHLTNCEFSEVAKANALQAGCCCTALYTVDRSVERVLTNGETLEFAMQMPWQNVSRCPRFYCCAKQFAFAHGGSIFECGRLCMLVGCRLTMVQSHLRPRIRLLHCLVPLPTTNKRTFEHTLLDMIKV